MPTYSDPLRLQTFIELGANPAPDVAPAGKARFWWDHANSLLKVSVNGGAYAPVLANLEDSLTAAVLLSAIPDGAFAADAATRALFADGIWTNAKLAAGLLSADATGRALMATDYFNAATLLLKVADGAFAADAATRALFANGIWLNAQLGTPKVTVYQETVAFGAFTDGGAAVGTYDLLHSIPAGARFLNALVTDITGFTGDTSAVLTIGDGTDVDRYNTGTPDVFVTAAAGVDLGAPSGTAWHTAAKTPKLTVTSGSDWGLVVAGSLTVTLFYLAP